VDLKGFEPLTSSMPFKKNQSLADITTENTRLSGGLLGRQWTPRRPFFMAWTPFGLRDSTPGVGTSLASSRAVAGRLDCCLLEKTTFCFRIKEDTHGAASEDKARLAQREGSNSREAVQPHPAHPALDKADALLIAGYGYI